MTSTDRLKSLAGCGDISSLKTAVEDICTEFGRVTRIDVLTMAEAKKRRALCFLRLESPEQERQLMNALGLPRFGDDVLVVVDFPSDSGRLVIQSSTSQHSFFNNRMPGSSFEAVRGPRHQHVIEKDESDFFRQAIPAPSFVAWSATAASVRQRTYRRELPHIPLQQTSGYWDHQGSYGPP